MFNLAVHALVLCHHESGQLATSRSDQLLGGVRNFVVNLKFELLVAVELVEHRKVLGPDWLHVLLQGVLRLFHPPLSSVLVVAFSYFENAANFGMGYEVYKFVVLSCNKQLDLNTVVL